MNRQTKYQTTVKVRHDVYKHIKSYCKQHAHVISDFINLCVLEYIENHKPLKDERLFKGLK